VLPAAAALRNMNAQSILELAPPPPGHKISYGDSEFQFGELRLPTGRGPHPAAIVIHGGYWRAAYDLKHIGHLCAALTRDGIATWSLEYRRIGNPGGGWPGTFDDIRQGAAHLSKIAGIDKSRVIAMGHSAGGHLALWLAKQRAIELRGVVPLAPVADLRKAFELRLSSNVVEEFLGGSPTQVPDRYRAASPIEMVPLGIRQRVIHGEHDDLVPIGISRAYVTAAKSKGDDVTLTEPSGAGHFELIDPRSSAWPVVRDTSLDLLN
jgi:acetyl esterase/lipase